MGVDQHNTLSIRRGSYPIRASDLPCAPPVHWREPETVFSAFPCRGSFCPDVVEPKVYNVSGAILKQVKQLAARMPLARQAAAVRLLLPRRAWYWAARMAAGAHGHLVARMGGNGPFTTAMMFDLWLRELSFGGAFPMPIRVTGAEIARVPGPRLHVWTHLPLTEVPLRVVLAEGGEPPVVVSDPGKVVGEDEFLVFGWPARTAAIPADGSAVRRVMANLREGRPVVFLADPYLGGALSDMPLRVAMRCAVPVVFQWAELGADGVLEVTFRYAPRQIVRNEDDIAVNMAFLDKANRAALARLGWTRPG